MSKTSPTPININAEYDQLLGKIKEDVLKTQQKIQLHRAIGYWHIGEHISKHLLTKKGRSGYGERLFVRLSHDLGIGERVLQRMVQFHREFPIPSAKTQLNWTQYVHLLSVTDKRVRGQLIRKVKSKKISVRQLKEEIKDIKAEGFYEKSKLIPNFGKIYTYRISSPKMVQKEQGYSCVDCGFGVWRKVPSVNLGQAVQGQIVESGTTEEWFKLMPTKRTIEDCYAYLAVLDYVIDGDTVVFEVDLGFRTWTRQKLRLRGIDAPELSTIQGKKSKEFLEDQLRNADQIAIKTYQKDKYDRYLVDIFIGDDKKYINQLLLDNKHAVLYNK